MCCVFVDAIGWTEFDVFDLGVLQVTSSCRIRSPTERSRTASSGKSMARYVAFCLVGGFTSCMLC